MILFTHQLYNMKWKIGRQDSHRIDSLEKRDYYKHLVYQFTIGRYTFDCYILKLLADTKIPAHRDPVIDAKHYRMNINIKGSCLFLIWGPEYRFGWIRVFRPDEWLHAMLVFRDSYILSFGMVIKNPPGFRLPLFPELSFGF